jgi:hypothetical protein
MKLVSKILTILIIVALLLVPVLLIINMFIWDSPVEVVSQAQAEYWDAIINLVLGFTVVIWWLASALKLIVDKMLNILYKRSRGKLND